MAFAEKLVAVRRAHNLTQDQLAEKLYVTRQAVSRWERGEVTPGIDMMKLIAAVTGEPLAHLLEMPEHYCESCGMYLTPDDCGTDATGQKTDHYCTWCYGAEARERYGNEAVDAVNERILDMDPATWNDMKELEKAILGQLSIALGDGDATGPEAAKLVQMHRRWIGLQWGAEPERDIYLGLVRGYLADPRFISYYDEPCGKGATAFLVTAVEGTLGE